METNDKELRELVYDIVKLCNPQSGHPQELIKLIESFVAKRVDDAKPKGGYYVHQHEVNKDQKREIVALTEENTKLKAEVKEDKLQLGLAEIHINTTSEHLKQCEGALTERDTEISKLKARLEAAEDAHAHQLN